MENLDRFITGLITVVPPALVVLAGWQLWNKELHLRDIVLLIILYIPIGLGVTIGFHRLLTHRSFKTSPALRGLFAVLGTMSVEGPVISWVSDHRKHHAYSDRLGDPHSPHVDHGGGWKGALRGLGHAHVGWLFDHQQRGSRERFATVAAGLEAMLWAGAVRIFILHHVTYSINSLCHFFGYRRFATEDESHNLTWLAPLSFGEAWHNNHHAFPTSAFHGMAKREVDLSGLTISGLERLGLVWDVQRISPDRQAAKALID
jgi:stearoyl-CoA desaturase (delta-9 desaturase)